MDFLKKPIVTYIGMFIAVIAIIAGAVGWPSFFSPDVWWGIASIAGFGSIASLRAFIETQGWKTYAATGIPIVINVFALFFPSVVTAEVAQNLSLAFAGITGVTLQQTASKQALLAA